MNSPRSSLAAWVALQCLLSLGVGGGILVVGYALVPVRVEKMETVYRSEGVQFAAGPDGVPDDKWQRMKTTQLEIVEPMANWLLGAGAALAVLSSTAMCLVWQLRPAALQPPIVSTPAGGSAA